MVGSLQDSFYQRQDIIALQKAADHGNESMEMQLTSFDSIQEFYRQAEQYLWQYEAEHLSDDWLSPCLRLA